MGREWRWKQLLFWPVETTDAVELRDQNVLNSPSETRHTIPYQASCLKMRPAQQSNGQQRSLRLVLANASSTGRMDRHGHAKAR